MRKSYDWFYEFREVADAEGRTADQGVCNKFNQAAGCSAEPARQLSLFQQARQMAETVGNRRLVLFADHWCAQCMMHGVNDHSQLLDALVPAVLEARKPEFRDLPQRFCLQEDLIRAYMSIDPLGHMQAIEEALGYFQREVPDDLECRLCYFHLRTSVESIKGNTETAWDLELETLATLQSIPHNRGDTTRSHHLTLVYSGLCYHAADRQDWAAVLENAVAGEPCAEQRGHSDRSANFRMWQAAAHKGMGNQAEAQRLFRSVPRIKRDQSLRRACSNPIVSYHVLSGRPHLAWPLREQELNDVMGQGRYWDECLARLERCKLAKQMNKPDLLQTEADALLEVAANLKNPQVITDKLDALIGQG